MRVEKERQVQASINEAAKAWVAGDHLKVRDICRALQAEGVQRPFVRLQEAIYRLKGGA